MPGRKRRLSGSDHDSEPTSRSAQSPGGEAGSRATKIDPVLTEQLDRAALDEEPIEAVCALRAPDHAERGLLPDEIEQVAGEVLSRVEQKVGVAPDRFKVFRNLSSMIVSASPAFVRALLDEDEIVSAMANVQPKGFKR